MTVPGNVWWRRLPVLLLLFASASGAQRFYTYVGDTSSDSVILAWGTTQGKGNTIGRASTPHGEAVVKVGGREETVRDRNWVRLTGLEPDRLYRYEVLLAGKRIGQGSVRTLPVKTGKVVFFVIGDYGTGSSGQRSLAKVMTAEFVKRWSTDNPARFVLTTGDNIYGKMWGLYATGDRDARWETTFFEPYETLLRHVPFYPTLGNHDGKGSESRGDLPVYLDNFFFPGGRAARYYSFSCGGLADFFALDSTNVVETGAPRPNYGPGSDQFAWLQQALATSQAKWKIAYFHHPPFSAGPRHEASLNELRHIHEALVRGGVRLAFNGHEHNFQVANRNEASGGIQYVVSGAGGSLRRGNVSGAAMKRENIAGWAPELHFLVVELDEREARITPVGTKPLRVAGPAGESVAMPLVVPAR